MRWIFDRKRMARAIPCGTSKSAVNGRSSGLNWPSGRGRARCVLSGDAEQRLRALGKRGELSPVLDGWNWAQGCRTAQLQQVSSYLRYAGRVANAFGKAACDPSRRL